MILFGTVHLKKLLKSILLTLGGGILVGLIAGDQGMVYETLVQPPFAPPRWVFGVVWSLLYLLMGVSLYLIRVTPGNHSRALKPFFLQLFVNFIWPILFFNFGWYCFSGIWLALLIFLVGITIYQFYQVKPAAAWLLVPYFIWCLFALYLNVGICILS